MIKAAEAIRQNAATPFWPKPRFGVVGVLGGMGPMATVDFLQKMLAHTPARRDQEHVPVVIASLPQIPDRTAAFQRRGPTPLSALVIPCNTTHLWFEAVEQALKVPMLHIDYSTLARLESRVGASVQSSGVLATGRHFRSPRPGSSARSAGSSTGTVRPPLP